MNPTITILLTLLFLNSCSTIAEGLGGSKKKGSEEFLIEKKAPLVLPPNFGVLPEPGKKINENILLDKEDTLSFEEIINKSPASDVKIEKNESGSLIEKSIIEKINKKKIKKVNLEEVIKIPEKKSFLQRLKKNFSRK